MGESKRMHHGKLQYGPVQGSWCKTSPLALASIANVCKTAKQVRLGYSKCTQNRQINKTQCLTHGSYAFYVAYITNQCRSGSSQTWLSFKQWLRDSCSFHPAFYHLWVFQHLMNRREVAWPITLLRVPRRKLTPLNLYLKK